LYEKTLNTAADSDGKIDELKIALWLAGGAMFFTGYYLTLGLNAGDGKFGDLNSMTGFLEKQGGKYTFGTDYAVPAGKGNSLFKDGSYVKESGEADLSAGTLWSEKFTKDPDGGITNHNRHDTLFKNGAMTALDQVSSDVDKAGKERKFNRATFVIVDESKYTFVVGTANQGAAMPFMPFNPDMSAADAKTMMEKAGYTIAFYGDMSGGKVNLQQ